jgi:hypothetical protein
LNIKPQNYTELGNIMPAPNHSLRAEKKNQLQNHKELKGSIYKPAPKPLRAGGI